MTRRIASLLGVIVLVTACGGGPGSGGSTTSSTSVTVTTSSIPSTTGVSGACPAVPGIPAIPGGATDLTSISGDFDADGLTDQFAVYGEGGVWYAHFIFDWGYGARVAIDAAALLIDPPGTGGPFVAADTTYGATDMNGDGFEEAWVYSTGPAANDVMSAFVYSPADCVPYHVSHHDFPAGPVTWLRGASVGSGENGLCFVPGGVIEYHIPGTSGGAEQYIEHSFSHVPLADHIGEFYGVGMLTAATVPASCGLSTGSTTVGVGAFCITDIAWDDTLNVRTGPGTAFPIIGTLPFYGFGIVNTGNTGTDSNGTWYEIQHGGGVGWVASWYLTPAPCGPVADFDLVVDLVNNTVDFDPGEWDPPGQASACGEGGFCWFNGSITDRVTLPIDPNAEVFLVDLDLSGSFYLPPITLAQFADYLAGIGYNPAIHHYEPKVAGADGFGKAMSGPSYTLEVTGGVVTTIRQNWHP